ncbi:MAG TPA: hypothetical protein VFI74_04755 [Candidatus Saccharimonadales bacterium]|nr:hypothetical protein [Candidatus Saccharimonadales bacterium]
MSPTQLQTDQENDSSSLERQSPQDSSVVTASSPITSDPSLSTLESSSITPDAPMPKPPFYKRIWQRFNIYLLLFILVILVVAGVVIFFSIKEKSQTTSNTINTQGLSESELKQLASSDSTIGSSKQTLNIESNAIFDGTVLMRHDLEVAGTIRVNGALALPGITVSGSSTFNQIQASTVGITGAATVQGVLTAKSGVNVTGNSSFNGNVSATQVTTGALQLNGDLVVTKHITAGGSIPGIAQGTALGSGGTATLSGSDTAGSITIKTGGGPGAGCFATINFSTAFSGTPHVAVTPIGASAGALSFYVNRSSSSFSVCTANAPPASQTFGFDYIILD